MAKKRKKTALDALEGQTDPRAPLDAAALLSAARPVLASLEEDLRARAEASPAVTRALRERYDEERAHERTAESFAGWTAALATQVAAAWLLSCVFVRTLEDRGLLRQARLAGPGALDSQRTFFQLAPSLTERDYLLMVFRELAHHPAARDLFDADHSLVWKLSPSADRVKELLALFRSPTADAPAFRFGQASTRFLGDLYQDLSEDVRKRYALLQTPDFVESFILDRTLEPAIERFGLDDTTVIDPTCGSGHFLLGAFDRLFEHRLRAEPGIDRRAAATRALDAVFGADINPYAVAIARFRLTLSYLEKAGYGRLADAPALPLHLVVADSLRINPQHAQPELWQREGVGAEDWVGRAFALEDEAAARDVLFRQYAAVVGNPPYITEKDPAKREVYRRMYQSAAGKYALSAPFCERFFQLARPRGYVGQITANSFMKREFGKKLIEDYLPTVNLELIVNTSGAYIPGHGTPTVLLFGTHEPATTKDVLAVLAKRGEPSTPAEPAKGLVWTSVAEHWHEVEFENDFISVARVARDGLGKHPWSLGGGGAAELKELLEERAERRLVQVISSVGPMSITGEDEPYVASDHVFRRHRLPSRPFVYGEVVRDWAMDEQLHILFPYDENWRDAPERRIVKWLWPYRENLKSRLMFGKTHEEAGLPWLSYRFLSLEKARQPRSIAFAFVATHNHFAMDCGGKVFNRTAPVIKLPADATEDDHLALLAYLNSSTACFWMKQVFYPKATSTGDISLEKGKPEANRYEFAGTGMLPLPVPPMNPSQREELARLAHMASELAAERDRNAADEVIRILLSSDATLEQSLAMVESRAKEAEQRLVAVQEDIDWMVYGLFGLAPICKAQSAPLHADSRAFLLRDSAANTPALIADRIRSIEGSDELRILEDVLYKRPWAGRRGVFGHAVQTPGEAATDAARVYLESAAEEMLARSSEPVRVVDLTKQLMAATGARRLVDDVLGGEARLREALLDGEAVPFLASLRLNEAGLLKWSEWLATWDAQRREDAGETVDIKVPPKYAPGDFLEARYFRLRGKLDVPKERFISYPGCESDEDGEPVYGWAGWDHLQRAQALASLYMKRKDGEGWGKERLTPMLAGLLELIPWVKQWHNEPSEQFDGLRMGDYFEQFLDGECRQLGLTHDDLRAWRPPRKTRKPPARKPKPPSTPIDVIDATDRRPPAPRNARKPRRKAPAASPDGSSEDL